MIVPRLTESQRIFQTGNSPTLTNTRILNQ